MFALIGFLFLIMGWYMPGIKPNWFVGIRTPWTLSSEAVWVKTHLWGARAFMLGGILFLLNVPFSGAALLMTTIVVFFATIVAVVVYSYVLYRRLNKTGE